MNSQKAFLGALVGALFVAGSAAAVEVKGSVNAKDEHANGQGFAVRPPYFQEWNGFIEPKKRGVDYAREVACVLIGGQEMRDATQVVLKNGALSPSTVVMQAGTSLRIRNEDDFTHKLWAEGLKAFDPIETSSGAGRQIEIATTGSFPIADKLAAHVRGTLHVLPKVSYVTYPKADGSFAFADAAPGHYTLKVFRGDKEVSSTEVDLPDRSEFEIEPAIAVDLKPGK
jgi:hypothetical protein